MNSCRDICWVSVWSYVSLWDSNKSEFLYRHLLSVTLKSCQFMSFTQNRFLMKAFSESLFEVLELCEFQTKVNSYEGICWVWVWSYVFYEFQTKSNSCEDTCWVSIWSYVSLRALNKGDFFWRHLLSLSFKLRKFMSFKQKRILMNKFVESQFELM